MTTSARVEPADDSRVLAAAVLWRATVGNSWDDADQFSHFYVVERLGHANALGFIKGVKRGRALTEVERSAIQAALAPRTVRWVASWDAVVDEQSTTTLPEDHAIITIAEPTITGPRAEVTTELWCAFTCGVGSITVLEQSSAGDWVVTEQIGGYIS